MEAALYILVGVVLLWKGGDWLVDGADRFARAKGMPASLAGVFILGFATSAPELFTSVLAALRGHPGIASGNVVGSNIANVALILGVAAVLAVVLVESFLRWAEWPIAIAASCLALFLFYDGEVSRIDGVVLLGAFVVYAVFAIVTAKHRPPPAAQEKPTRPSLDLCLAALGLGALLVGAHFFLEGAIVAARAFEVTETVIGLTLVALGTSLPELATTVAAARSDRMEMAVGNVVGSNIFNLLLVLGVASVLNPQPTEPRMFRLDLPVMLGLAGLAWLFAVFGGRIRRWQGWFFLAVYFGYLGVTVLVERGIVTLP